MAHGFLSCGDRPTSLIKGRRELIGLPVVLFQRFHFYKSAVVFKGRRG